MLAKRIIPCLDVTGGRVVKGVNFVELRDAGDPVEIAARYNEQGADELTFLDITATSDGRDLILHIIEAVASQVFIPLTVGGGVRTVADVRRLLNAGADKVSFNSAAVADPQVIRDASDKYGAQCIVVAIDAKARPGGGWDVYTHGGRKNTGLDAVAWATQMAAVRRRRDPAHQHGPRRHEDRLRPGTHARGQRRGAGAGDRLGRRRRAGAPVRRHPHRRRRRGAGRQHLPLRRVHRRPGQGADGARRHPGAPVKHRVRHVDGQPQAVRLHRSRPHEVRLIGGQWKRSKLPVADSPGLRPTPDRVRETLFNWLGQDLNGWRVLDAFAGSGALGFEAASRGAAEVLLLERDPALVASLEASRTRLKARTLRVRARRRDGLDAARRRRPASSSCCSTRRSTPSWRRRLRRLQRACWCRAAIVYVEAAEPLADLPAGLEAHRQSRAGAVCFQLLRRRYTPPVAP